MLKFFTAKVSKKFLDWFCKIIGRDNITFIQLNHQEDLLELGTKYGGWVFPKTSLTPDSIVYCVGCGEDISFDLSLIDQIGCDIFGFDPTPRAIRYVKSAVKNNAKYHFSEIGLWDKDDLVKFYAPENPEHISHSLLNLQRTSEFFTARVRRLSGIMQEYGHKRIDLLKLDIEGAEYRVIESIIKDELDIRVLCVEYDECHHPLDDLYILRVKQSISSLINAGFSLVFAYNGNYTFVKKYFFYPNIVIYQN